MRTDMEMALTLADYLRDHPIELDDKSFAYSQTTAGFTTFQERVCSNYYYNFKINPFILLKGLGISQGYGSGWSVSTGYLW